ncbi:uncharacterized protein VTP21DRAFT_908 [Calcarisporiella thermophila]|uniref:uncharacterized protein n=1 Tax=Calcarisporiella thermophila TaxID=911321 RepID=UPI003743A4D2
MVKEFDIVVFGATGFTARHICKELQRTSSTLQRPIRWAIAGRSMNKLNELAETLQPKPDILIADVHDEKSLVEIFSRSHVCIDAVGPYALWGEPVVRACIKAKCDYLDVTGEPQYVSNMLLKYNEEAKNAGVTIVHCCAFDSVPADIGILYAKRAFQERGWTPTQVESYCRLITERKKVSIHFGTFYSAVEFMASPIAHFQTLRRAHQSLPKIKYLGPHLLLKLWPRYESKVKGWVLPMPLDPIIVWLSQRIYARNHQPREEDQAIQPPVIPPVQYMGYVVFPSLLNILQMLILGAVVGLFSLLPFTRSLLKKHPEKFTMGVFTHQGPTQEEIANLRVHMVFFTRGYETRDAVMEDVTTLNRSLITTVDGGEPAYVITSQSAVQCAYTLLLERDKVPRGVHLPSSAFSETSLVERLDKAGLKFQVQEQK